MIKALIFDLGGVVVSPEVEKILNYVAEYIGINFDSFYGVFKSYKSDLTKGNISLIEAYQGIVNHFQLKDVTAQDILDEHLRIFQIVIENLDEKMLSLVEKLKQHYQIVCLANAEKDVVRLVRKRGIYDHFQKAYISVEMNMEKPDSEIYLAVLHDINCRPEETVFIDDKKPNVEAAEKLRIHGILYKDYNGLVEEFEKLHLEM